MSMASFKNIEITHKILIDIDMTYRKGETQ